MKAVKLTSIKMLIAEDEPIMLKTMELKLKRDDYQVISANNGRDAIPS